MSQAPSRWEASALADYIRSMCPRVGVKRDGIVIYVPARPDGDFSFAERLRLTWAVFSGKADALFWNGQ